MTRAKIHTALFAVAFLAAMFLQKYADEKHPAAPTISLADISGHRLDLASFRGKVVVLNFWVTWWEPCRAEIPDLVELQKRYLHSGLVVLGIAMQDDLG